MRFRKIANRDTDCRMRVMTPNVCFAEDPKDLAATSLRKVKNYLLLRRNIEVKVNNEGIRRINDIRDMQTQNNTVARLAYLFYHRRCLKRPTISELNLKCSLRGPLLIILR